VDHETDHGVKADELVQVLSDVLEDDAAKVVVFSQWLRMHELVARRLDARAWSHVLFSGDVPGPKRKDLIHRFREDPKCRLFLATDAGGVGLNLQHASVVVNLDQPWNPAVLEQRIGRVHRLGQHRPVRVIHFISKGTIEEGMLGLLAFKKSVFAGVLDGGQNEVFMGGTRLTRFMESVEQATQSIPQPVPEELPEPEGHEAPSDEEPPRDAPQIIRLDAPHGGLPQESPSGSPWGEVITAGMTLLEKLARTLSSPAASGAQAPGSLALPNLVSVDESGGEPYLRLPMPKPEVMEKLAGLLSALAERL
jgi:hypothetical protein